MSKIVALQTDPTTDGSIIVVPSNQATLNGLPIATKGSKLLYKGSPTDQPLEFVPGILINNKPLTFVGAKTSAGASILTANQTTATIEAADASNGEENKPEDDPRIVELFSDYPLVQLQKMAEQLAKSTFYILMVSFFDKDIPQIAYEKLYNLLSEKDESLMPEIVVLKSISKAGNAAFNRVSKEIEVLKKTVVLSVEGSEIEKAKARADLLQNLLEEYGHFLDDILRNKFSGVHGDALKDEGAVYSYYFTNYQITDDNISFATAKLDHGEAVELIIDLSEIVQIYNDIKERVDADFKDNEREFYKMGKGNISMREYGHFDFANQLLTEKVLPNKYSLSWLYLGNFMRDMSQVITPAFSLLTAEEKAEVDSADPDIRSFFKYNFFDAFKFRRETWTNIVEVMAAHHTMAEYEGEEVKAIKDKGSALTDKILKPSSVTEELSSGKKVQDFLSEKAIDLGLKGVKFSLEYMNFIKHFDHMSQDDLGVYRPEEHIDNPMYAAVYDDRTSPKSLYYCPPLKKGINTGTKPTIGDVYGMKRHIRNEENGKEKNSDIVDGAVGLGDYAGGELPTAVKKMKDYYTRGVHIFKSDSTNPKHRLKGLSDIGAGMHILEDFFAHTNFCEILLIKHGLSVYPWVNIGDPELTNYNGEGKYFKLKKSGEKPANASDLDGKKGDLTETFFGDIEHLHRSLSETGTITLLPSFWVKGVYFIYRANRSGSTKKLYLASGMIATGDGMKEDLNKQDPGILESIEDFVKGDDPLNLQCTEPRKRTIYSYNSLNCSVVNEETLQYRQKENSTEKNKYDEQIPLVTGYFSFSDTIHSLVPLLQKLFEKEDITLKGLFIDNSFKYDPALQLVDMVVLYLLADMEISQQEEDKSAKDTGKEKADLIKIYRELILMRGVILGVMEAAKKKAGVVGLLIFLVNRLITVGYTLISNAMKSIVNDMLEAMNHTIVDWQSMQISTDIGTNPSHSQLAKDETNHPLHSLAADLTLAAVKGLKPAFEDLLSSDSPKESYKIAQDFQNFSLKFMKHPSQCAWADEVVKKWIAENPDRILLQHTHEHEFQEAVLAGKNIKAAELQLTKLRIEFEKKLAKTSADFKQAQQMYIKKINIEWSKLEKNYREFKARAIRLKEGVEAEIEKTLQQADEYYENLKEWWQHQISLNENTIILEGQFVRNSAGLNFKVEEIIVILKNQKMVEASPLNVTGQLKTFHDDVVKQQLAALKNKTPFEENLMQYCANDTKDEKYKEYGQKMKEYDNFRLQAMDVEKKYLAQSPEYHLEKLNQSRNA